MSTAAPGAGPIRSGDGELEQLAGSPESRLVLRRLGFGGALAYRGCLWPNNKRVRTKQTLPTNCHTKGGTHTSFIVLYMYTIGRQSEFPPRDQSVSKCDIPPSLPRHTQHNNKSNHGSSYIREKKKLTKQFFLLLSRRNRKCRNSLKE